jgi:hypothetical protein
VRTISGAVERREQRRAEKRVVKGEEREGGSGEQEKEPYPCNQECHKE